MTSDDAAAPTGPRSRPVWVWVLVAVCVLVGVGLVVAIAGLFMAPSPQPEPPPSAGAGNTASPATPGQLDVYRLTDSLPLTSRPVWHAQPSAEYQLTAAPDELRYVSPSGCRIAFRSGPLRPTASPSAGRTTPPPASAATSPAGPPSPTGSPSPTADPETAATRAALTDAIDATRKAAAGAAVTDDGFVVVTTLDSLGGPLVDMAGASLRVAHADGTVTHVRLAVRAVPSAQSAVAIATECPEPEEAATAMNHASVHAYLAGE